MKSRFLAVLAVFAFAICGAFCVACDDPEPPTPPTPEPMYVAITMDEFLAKAEELTAIANYMSVSGYEFNLNTSIVEGMMSNDTQFSVLLDLSQLDDVAVSANFISTTLYPPQSDPASPEQDSSGAGEIRSMIPTQITFDANLYLYNQTLYLDYTSDGQTRKDSMTGVNNDLTSLLGELLIQTAQEESTTPSFEVGEELAALMVYLADYLTITYCEEYGHYVFTLDYSEGGVYEGTEIDPFEFEADLYAKNGRFTEINFEFNSLEYKAEGALAEYRGSINYPEQPDTYEGDLIEELIELFMQAE